MKKLLFLFIYIFLPFAISAQTKIYYDGTLGFDYVLSHDSVIITNVEYNSSAYRAGIRRYNKILAINGKHLTGKLYDWQIIDNLVYGKAGSKVWLTLQRKNKISDIILIYDFDKDLHRISNFSFICPDSVNIAFNQLQKLESLKFIKKESEEFVVNSTIKKRLAEKNGIKKGDKIISINGIKVYNLNQVSNLLKYQKDKLNIIAIERGKDTIYIQNKEELKYLESYEDHSICSIIGFENRYNSKLKNFKTWMKIEFETKIQRDHEIYIKTSLDTLKIYIPDGKGHFQMKQTGDNLPLDERDVKSEEKLISFWLEKDKKYIFYIYGPPVILKSISIIPKEVFYEETNLLQIINAAFFGIIAIMIIYNLILLFAFRQISYLYYLIYLFCCGLLIMNIFGYGFEFLWPGNPKFSEFVFPFFGVLAFAMYNLFTQKYLETKKYSYKWHVVLNIILVTQIFFVIETFLIKFFDIKMNEAHGFISGISVVSASIISGIAIIGTVFSCILFIFPAAISIKKDNKAALFYLLANLSFVFVLLLIGLLNGVFKTEINETIGKAILQMIIVLQIVFFTLGLGQKVNFLEKTRIKSQNELIKQLKTNEELKDKVNRELEAKVNERTLEIQKQNEEIQAQNEQLYQQKEEILAINDNLNHQKEELQTTLENLRKTQAELIQSEKMASLGQLIAGIAHEINTPLGAIKASIGTITDSSHQSIQMLPQLFKSLNDEQIAVFLDLVNRSTKQTVQLTSKEERAHRKTLSKILEENQIENADEIADTLVDMGVFDTVEPYYILFTSNSLQTLQTAYHLSMQIKNSNNIKMAVDRASKIVFALKSYARYGNEQSKVKANIVDGFETVLTLYHNQLKHGISVHKQFDSVPELLCFPDELNQVWTNIIHNAIQAMNGKGDLSIKIATTDNNSPNKSIQVSISDSGQGIPEEIKTKIFNAFFTTKPAGEGSGLGLHIVKQIIDKHQGEINFESEIGKGTTFIISLPIIES